MTVRGEGWYADPQQEGMLRWWDGSVWTAYTHDPTVPTTHHPPLARWWDGLTVALQLGLLLNLAASVYILYVDQEILAFVEELRLRPDTVSDADAARIDQLTLWSSLELLPWLATGVLFVIWSYTLHHSSRMDRSVLRHGSGWAIGGWFVPVLGLWRPFQMVLDVRRGATGDADLPTTRRLGWWWATFWASYVLNLVAGYFYQEINGAPEDGEDAGLLLDNFASAATWERGSAVLTIVCALLAVRVVREVRSLVRAEPA